MILSDIDDLHNKTPLNDMSTLQDPRNGAHFQYKELLKRLSDITNSSNSNSSVKKITARK